MHRFRANSCLYSVLVALLASSAIGQDDQKAKNSTAGDSVPAATFSVKVKVVNVLATVRDKHGKIVNNLTKDDFSLAEDGRPQSIHYFSRETDLPLTLGLLVDTSLSQRRVLDQERDASHSFLDQMVRQDKDKAFIIHFDREVELLQDLTSSHEKLEKALEEVQTPQYNQDTGSGGNWPSRPGGPGRRGGHHGGGTMLYDAIFLASNELMQKQEGRKALVLLTDGVDTGSKETLDAAIEAAQKSNTLVYTILFKDDQGYGSGGYHHPSIGFPGGGWPAGRPTGGHRYPGQRPDGKKVLGRISKETGGHLFEVSKKEPIAQIYSQIGDELRNQYNLGYTPDGADTEEPGYHKIQVSATQKDLTVQARDGYYSDNPRKKQTP